jgi:hypothetical protein
VSKKKLEMHLSRFILIRVRIVILLQEGDEADIATNRYKLLERCIE